MRSQSVFAANLRKKARPHYKFQSTVEFRVSSECWKSDDEAQMRTFTKIYLSVTYFFAQRNVFCRFDLVRG